MSLISNRIKYWIKLGISAVLLVSLILFQKIDLDRCWKAFIECEKWSLVAGFIAYLAMRALLARRWQLLAAVVGFNENFWRMLQLTFIGQFFNCFLPSTIGGDASRCFYLCSGKFEKGSEKYIRAASSLVVDRVTGLASLLLFSVVGLITSPLSNALPSESKLLIIIMSIFTFILFPMLPQITRIILGQNNKLSISLNKGPISHLWKSRKSISNALLISFLVQILSVLTHILIGVSLGLSFQSVPILYYFVVYSLTAVVSLVTPSVNGMGVREWSYTFLLAEAGIDKSIALTYSMIWLIMTLSHSLIGGIIHLFVSLESPSQNDSSSES